MATKSQSGTPFSGYHVTLSPDLVLRAPADPADQHPVLRARLRGQRSAVLSARDAAALYDAKRPRASAANGREPEWDWHARVARTAAVHRAQARRLSDTLHATGSCPVCPIPN